MAVVWLNGEEWEPLGTGFYVVDGDSLKRGDLRIRLAGIDAPETEQTCIKDGRAVTCGTQAKQHLSKLLANQDIVCSNEGNDKHGRQLSICKIDGATVVGSEALVVAGLQNSINAQMVHDGWAVAYGDYIALEILAAIAKRGLWALEFEEPEQWRRENGLN
ncbi:MAG: thermonuclease family protein [Hyphomicrobiales bacterium]